jgi:hypothetical protein
MKFRVTNVSNPDFSVLEQPEEKETQAEPEVGGGGVVVGGCSE